MFLGKIRKFRIFQKLIRLEKAIFGNFHFFFSFSKAQNFLKKRRVLLAQSEFSYEEKMLAGIGAGAKRVPAALLLRTGAKAEPRKARATRKSRSKTFLEKSKITVKKSEILIFLILIPISFFF